MLKKDSYGFGAFIGLVFPLILFWFLFGLDYFTGILSHPPVVLSVPKIMFISAALNVIPIRYYFVSLDAGRTGRAILLITVVMVLAITLIYR